jgi:CHASE3 domain sensor protein
MKFFKKNIDSFVIFLTLVIVLISSFVFYTNFRKSELLEDEIYIIEQKRNELSKLYNVELKTVRAKRGYQFSKFQWELNQYLQSKEETIAELDSVKNLFQEDEYLQKLNSLEGIIEKRLNQFDRHIALIQVE